MKYQRRIKVIEAVQWKGWPHKINGLIPHPTYPQLADFNGVSVYKGDYIVSEGKVKYALDNFKFNNLFKKID